MSREAIAACFGKHIGPVSDYIGGVVGLQAMLEDAGVSNFTADEMTNYGQYLPPMQFYPRGVFLACWAQKMRSLVNEPVQLRWWYRPPEVNRLADGAPGSDHLTSNAIDLVFRSRRSLEKARLEIVEPLYATGLFDMSKGIGARTMHIGFWSPKGHRRWWYESYGNREESGAIE